DAGREMLQQSAREDRHGDMRRLQRVAASRHGAGLYRHEAIAAFLVGEDAAEANEIRIARLRLRVLGMRIFAGSIGLPYLEERIRHRRAVAVAHLPLDDDGLALRHAAAGEVGELRPRQPDMKEGPDGLRGGRHELHLMAPSAWRRG